MSKSEAGPSMEYDFWEFVACAKCRLPFSSDTGEPPCVPFWITECGHVLCNAHLQPDQSCAKCGAQNIQIAPLHREIEPPMSDWFTPVPNSLDALAYATRYQMNHLASLVRYYKRKCTQQRAAIENLKSSMQENHALRNTIQQLRTDNQRLQSYLQEPSDLPNMNGKRRMQEVHRHVSGVRSNSSPRTVVTPIGPPRLTMPPGQQQPSFGVQYHSDDTPQVHVDKQSAAIGFTPSKERPGSRRFAEQYAYVSPQQQRPPVAQGTLSHAQVHPVRQAHGRRQHQHDQNTTHTTMLPPPALPEKSKKFKPAGFRPPARNEEPPNMPPPGETPRHARQQLMNTNTSRGPTMNMAARSTPACAAQDQMGGQHLRMSTPVPQPVQTQRFVPSTPSGRRGPHPLASGSGMQGSNNTRAMSHANGGQRMPFVPGNSTSYQ